MRQIEKEKQFDARFCRTDRSGCSMKYGALLNRKTFTNGTTRRFSTALSPASSLLKSVCLHDWWLIKPQEGEEGLAVAGFSSREGMPVRAIKSAAISKRHDATTLETVDGFTISLVGFINKDLTLQNGFSSEVCNRFQFGFSYDWEEYTVKGSKEILCSQTNGLAKHAFKRCLINKSKYHWSKDLDPLVHSHQESDCQILTKKTMENLFECVRDLEQNGSLNDSSMSDGVMMPPVRTQLNNTYTCFSRDNRGFAKKFTDTVGLNKSFQFVSCKDRPRSTKPGHVDNNPESDQVVVPAKRKYTNAARGSFTLGTVNCNSVTMIDSVESHTTLEAGCTPRAMSDKPAATASRRITRSMTKERKKSS